MKLLIDNADMEKIRRAYDFYPMDGVTTNPTILASTGRKPYEVLEEIRCFIGEEADLHVQVISRTADDMVREGHRIANILGKNTYLKIPAIKEGIKAIRLLSGEGYRVTGTAIYSVQQAWLSGKSGACYVAPYVNRIDSMGEDGVEVTRRIHALFKTNEMNTAILAASFKNTRQVLALAEAGISAATVSPEVIESLLQNPSVACAVDTFIQDFERIYGAGTTM